MSMNSTVSNRLNNLIPPIQLFVRSLLVVNLLILPGCASQLKQTQSGFLQDYSQLKLVKEFENTRVYRSAKFDQQVLSKIDSIKLVPFEVWIKQADVIGINVERVKKLHGYFQSRLKQKLQHYFPIVENAGENTLTLRGAFSGVKLKQSELSLTDFIPLRIVTNAGNSAYLAATDQKDIISEVSIEAELLLGEKQEIVFAMTATKSVSMTVSDSSEGNFEAVTKVLDIWVDGFVKKMIEVKSR